MGTIVALNASIVGGQLLLSRHPRLAPRALLSTLTFLFASLTPEIVHVAPTPVEEAASTEFWELENPLKLTSTRSKAMPNWSAVKPAPHLIPPHRQAAVLGGAIERGISPGESQSAAAIAPDPGCGECAEVVPMVALEPGQNLVLQVRSPSGRVATYPLQTARDQLNQPEPPPQVVEISANTQEYDEDTSVVTARGDVVVRFNRGVLTANRVQVNVEERIAVAEGEVALRRGDQVLRGSRFEYFFVQDRGVIFNASGEVYQPTLARDFSPTLPTDVSAPQTFAADSLSDRLVATQPLEDVRPEGDVAIGIGAGRTLGNVIPEVGGTINRLRFRADRAEFAGDVVEATDVRITNDPFSPPELEVRADTATFRRLDPLRDEITTSNSRIVFDQDTSVPIFQDRIVLDRRERDPGIIAIGFDGDERGGLFLERTFEVYQDRRFRFRLTPQYFLQEALFDQGPVDSGVVGLQADLDGNLSPRTQLEVEGEFIGFEFDELDEDFRGSIRLRQDLGPLERPHTLNLEYSYRDRLFNGSLGFQTVRSNLGAVVTSPVYELGDTGFSWSYQGGIAAINAESDRDDLLDNDGDDRLRLTRLQGAASLGRGFLLWEGEGLPPTEEEGLRYSPEPVVPFLRLVTGFTGVASFYSSGDTQESLSFTVGVEGQVGNFSRQFFDYTGFSLRYSQGIRIGRSPFEFDRFVDLQRVELGIIQQIYGPLRAGIRTEFDLDEGEEIETDYILEYVRRSYNIRLRVNPQRELGALSIEINGFNWSGSAEPFAEVDTVIQGVER